MAWLGDWGKRIEIAIDNSKINSDLTYHPVPVFLGTSVGMNGDDVSAVFDEVGSNWKKIAITDASATKQLYIEKEKWDATAEEAVLHISRHNWTINSSSQTTIYLYYDNEKNDNDKYIFNKGDLNFQKDVNNPIFTSSDIGWATDNPSNQVILRDPVTGKPAQYNNKYWSIYSADSKTGIGVAYSTDLVNWTDSGDNPILEVSDTEAESWEKESLDPNDFLYMGDYDSNNDFWLFYKAHPSGGTQNQIGVAKGNAPTTLSRDTADNPIADWIPTNADGIEDWRVQRNSSGNWLAAYEADSKTSGVAVHWAKSTDTLPDTGWTDQGELLPAKDYGGYDFIANPSFIRIDENGETYYEIFYEGVRTGPGYGDIMGAWVAETNFGTPSSWTQTNRLEEYSEAWENSSSYDIIPNCAIYYNDEIWVVYESGPTGLTEGQALHRSLYEPEYRAIYHMAEDPSTTIIDSTSHLNELSSAGSMGSGDQVAAKIDGGVDLDGTDDYLDTSEQQTIEPDYITIEVWMNTDLNDTQQHIVEKDTYDGGNAGYYLMLQNLDNIKFGAAGVNAIETAEDTIVPGNWHYIVGRVSSGEIDVLIDNVQEATGSGGTISPYSSRNFTIGRYVRNDGRYFDGIIDEIRISGLARSDAEINANYSAQQDNLLTFEAEEKKSAAIFFGCNW